MQDLASHPQPDSAAAGLDLADALRELRRHSRLLVVAPLAAGTLALGATYLLTPQYTASTSFLPPQQQQSAASSALQALGSLGSLAGVGGAALRTPADQYVALMQSVTVSDRIVDQFELMAEYRAKLRVDARRTLAERVRISSGKKDGLISVAVVDRSPQRAADIANRYVEELRRMTGQLALTEAQQRRSFFEQQLLKTREQLAAAQQRLRSSGFDPDALKAEPKANAEGYARLKAEVVATEVKLQALRGRFADSAPEVQQQLAALGALRTQLSRSETPSKPADGASYIDAYRDYKYQEALYEVYARQFELARVDESREGALIQVVDAAQPPEQRSFPRRTSTAVATTLISFALLLLFVLGRAVWRRRAAAG